MRIEKIRISFVNVLFLVFVGFLIGYAVGFLGDFLGQKTIEPFAKKQHENKMLELQHEQTMNSDMSKRNSEMLENDIKIAEKVIENKETEHELLSTMAFSVAGGMPGYGMIAKTQWQKAIPAMIEVDNRIAAFNCAKDYIYDNIKSPVSSDFGDQDHNSTVEKNSNNTYKVNMFVDSFNAFGTMQRTKFEFSEIGIREDKCVFYPPKVSE